MGIFKFLLFDFISFTIHIFILLFAYRFLTRKKCNIFSKIAEKQIEDYWGSFDNDKSITDIDMDHFVESIHVLDDNVESQDNNELQHPTRF